MKMLSHVSLTHEDVKDQISDPKNRRHSLNMILAYNTLKKIIEEISTDLKDEIIDVIFCTGEGELQQTYNFFQALKVQNIARPIFFQNSLHNSTFGAVSVQFQNISSGTTLTSGDLSIENAVEITLSNPSNRLTVILGVDVYPDDLYEVKSSIYGKNVKLSSGASASLFIPNGHQYFNDYSGIIIKDVIYQSKDTSSHQFTNYFATNSLITLSSATCSGELIIPRANDKIATYTLEV